jgi:hypothetical protein
MATHAATRNLRIGNCSSNPSEPFQLMFKHLTDYSVQALYLVMALAGKLFQLVARFWKPFLRHLGLNSALSALKLDGVHFRLPALRYQIKR